MEDKQLDQPEKAAPRAELRSTAGLEFPLSHKNLIGRSDPARGEVDIDLTPLPEGGFVSRQHAEIWWEDEQWWIKDLGSSNGTFLISGDERRKVDGETVLTDGETIAFGTAELVFAVEPSELEDHLQDTNQE